MNVPDEPRRSARAPRTETRYGWAIVAVLAVTETVSWGVLYYAFAVFLVPMQRELGWSKGELTGAFSLALATAALAAFPVGRWLDRRSPRALMTFGSLLGALLVLAWSQVRDLWLFYVIWIGLGVAMACVLYDAAFTVVTKWFREGRRRALTAVTLVGGFASFVFSPLSNWLIDAQGWRDALITLAIVVAAVSVPLHGLLLRAAASTPSPEGAATAPAFPRHQRQLQDALREPAFWWLTAAFALSSFAISALAVHLIPYLLERGQSASFAAGAAGLMGLMQVPGRLVFVAAGRVVPRRYEAAAVFFLQGLGLAALAASATGGAILAAVALFGMGNGMATLVRATAIADAYGPARFGSIAGVTGAFATGSRAVAPVTAAGVYAAFGGYLPLLWILVATSVLACAAAGLAGPRLGAPGRR
jgi:MFS family permease